MLRQVDWLEFDNPYHQSCFVKRVIYKNPDEEPASQIETAAGIFESAYTMDNESNVPVFLRMRERIDLIDTNDNVLDSYWVGSGVDTEILSSGIAFDRLFTYKPDVSAMTISIIDPAWTENPFTAVSGSRQSSQMTK